ncbi:MAG: GAF domain-containing protein [Elusimicrobiota bacterium]|nr:MAG: GAF domain-containing protein [Elusimicrobiota bacterium]
MTTGSQPLRRARPRLAALLARAIEIDGADMGTLQRVDPDGVLRIVAHRGFDAAFLRHFAEVRPFDGSACGRAAGASGCVVIADIEEDAAFEPHRAVARRNGMRSVKSCPVRSAGGRLLGILSTHCRAPRTAWDRGHLDELLLEVAALLEPRLP